jgi:hypothetical protein
MQTTAADPRLKTLDNRTPHTMAWELLRTSTRLTLILLLLLHSSVSKFNPQGKSCSDIDASASFECFSVALMQGQGTAARGG